MQSDTDASNFMPRLETGNAELRAQLATAQEYLAKLERVAQENFAVYWRQGETCDALRADLVTERRKRLHATDHIAALRELLLDDVVVMENLREDWENAEKWAQHYQEQAERKVAKVQRLKRQTRALAAEVERLTAELQIVRSVGVRLDGDGPEYVTTDADGRVTHYGRGRVIKPKPLICTDDMPGYESDSSADAINEATDLTNRETDAALRRLAQQETI